jgi:hypothetical protein
MTVSRYREGFGDGSGFADASVTMLHFSPSVLFRLRPAGDEDDVTVLPVFGGGVNFLRATTNISVFGEEEDESESSVGFHGFGGAELFFGRNQAWSLSGGLGYYTTDVPFSFVDVSGFAWSFSLHWYVP